MKREALDLRELKTRLLAERHTLYRVEDILVDPDTKPAACGEQNSAIIGEAARRILNARSHGAGVILMYGAHLLRNGAAKIVTEMMERGWITHLATNGAGSIHDWEFAWLGASCESVEENVGTGTFGTWEETGRNIHIALLAGALDGKGYGESLGCFILDDGCSLPQLEELRVRLSQLGQRTPAVADCLSAMQAHGLSAGRHEVVHRWKHASLLAQATRLEVPVTIHPGIGYDIISCHPMFSGAVIGRAAAEDFRSFCESVNTLDGGVVLSVGSAIMAPQVFEKSLSCVHNLRLQRGSATIQDHAIYVVDLQDGGGWDWSQGEPPRTSPAYYLRFCKSFSRMGGQMRYSQCDNLAFMHHLLHALRRLTP
jgi:hypothetical protein